MLNGTRAGPITPDNADANDHADKELDLRARLVGHYAVARGVELYGALSPGYTILLSGTDGAKNATGFARF